MSQFEVRANIKFLTKLQWKPTEIIETLQNVYGDSSPSRAVVYRWIRRFKDGRDELEDDPREGRPSTSKNAQNVELVRNLVEEDRRITVIEIANELGISAGSTFSILTDDLGFSKLSARWVPKALQQHQMDLRSDLSLALLTRIEAKTVRTILREFRWEILSHPPYSPDLAPSDFFLFPKLKEHLKGTRFQSILEAKREVVTWLTRQAPEFYQEGISRWKHRLRKCFELGGSYVEK